MTKSEKKISRKEFALDRDKLVKGVPLSVRLPDGRYATLYILSRWSDTVRKAVDEVEKTIREEARSGVDHSWEDEQAATRRLVASFIGGWDLAEKCTPEECVALLEDAPYLQDRIDRKAGETAAFFPSSGKSS